MNTFGNRLKLLRLEHNLNGIELGKKFNFSKSTISSWENETREPSQDVLKQLAEYFDVSIDYMIGVSDTRNPLIHDNNIKDNTDEVHSFTVKLVNELLKEGIINDINNIPIEITDMIIAALKHDLKNKKETK